MVWWRHIRPVNIYIQGMYALLNINRSLSMDKICGWAIITIFKNEKMCVYFQINMNLNRRDNMASY